MKDQNRAKKTQEIPDVSGRLPPHDLGAEAYLLSWLMRRGEYPIVADLVTAEDFYAEENALIWEAIAALDAAEKPTTHVLIASWLNDRERLEKAGGEQYIQEIVRRSHLTPASSATQSLPECARIVAKKAQQRRVIAAAQLIAAEGYGDVGDPDLWMASATSRIQELAKEADPETGVHIQQSIRETAEAVREMLAHKGRIIGISTGFRELDKHTSGLQKGQTTLISGETGSGKTALACNIALNVAEQGIGVMIFSLEMRHQELASRLSCAKARVSWQNLCAGRSSVDDLARLDTANQALSVQPIIVDDSSDLTPSKLRARLVRVGERFKVAGLPLGLVVLDYLQLMDGKELVERGANREQEVSKIAREFIRVVREQEMHGLLLSQLNDDGQIRESRAALQHSHNWWNLEREQPQKGRWAPPPDGSEIVSIWIKKQRSGPRGVVARTNFHPEFVLFAD